MNTFEKIFNNAEIMWFGEPNQTYIDMLKKYSIKSFSFEEDDTSYIGISMIENSMIPFNVILDFLIELRNLENNIEFKMKF